MTDTPGKIDLGEIHNWTQERVIEVIIFLVNNRWAAFTNAELAILTDALQYIAVGSDQPADDLAEDLQTELTRRKDADGS
jgi:hypothetical protein